MDSIQESPEGMDTTLDLMDNGDTIQAMTIWWWLGMSPLHKMVQMDGTILEKTGTIQELVATILEIWEAVAIILEAWGRLVIILETMEAVVIILETMEAVAITLEVWESLDIILETMQVVVIILEAVAILTILEAWESLDITLQTWAACRLKAKTYNPRLLCPRTWSGAVLYSRIVLTS